MSLAPEHHRFSKQLGSNCLVTVKAGTNFSDEVPRDSVTTHFSLRFDQAGPFKIKGLKEAEAFVGFDISITGPDECEQLIKALELAAAELRWQAKLPLEELPYTPTPEEAADDAEGRWLASEVEILALLLFHGNQPTLGGPTIWRYLRSQLQHLPPLMSGPFWSLLLEAYQKDQEPTLAWLQPHVGGEDRVLSLLADYDPSRSPLPAEDNASAIRVRCDAAINRYFIAALRGHQLELLANIGSEPDEQERQTMLEQLRTLESRQAYLVNQKI